MESAQDREPKQNYQDSAVSNRKEKRAVHKKSNPSEDRVWKALIRHYDGRYSNLEIKAPTIFWAINHISRHFGTKHDFEVTSLKQVNSREF